MENSPAWLPAKLSWDLKLSSETECWQPNSTEPPYEKKTDYCAYHHHLQ